MTTTSPDVIGDFDSQPEDALYQQLVLLGNRAAQEGRLDEARLQFERALEQAAAAGEDEKKDRAFCNLAAIEIELRTPFDRLIPRLRDILVRNGGAENCRLASYHLARIYEIRKEYRKALFYARIASTRAEQLNRRDWMASSRNQIGNALLAESRFDEATPVFEEALDILTELQAQKAPPSSRDRTAPPQAPYLPSGTDDMLRALILDNLGYCWMIQGRLRSGFGAAFAALRLLRRHGARWWEAAPHLTLCFGYLEMERLRPAIRHGLRALALAEEVGDEEALKNGYFLLGEIYNSAGDSETAYRYFAKLQRRFYPDQEYIPDFLLAVDVRQLVNLKG